MTNYTVLPVFSGKIRVIGIDWTDQLCSYVVRVNIDTYYTLVVKDRDLEVISTIRPVSNSPKDNRIRAVLLLRLKV
ncbi:hypothetical protein T11_15221 [Trichinella zimbabwensis]|uniref:Uncharacterized protein n=1 Tax=Trichinella zimbabwensis TaxID=268475 RepID=A0A0V1HVH5_9BILA|nr:hypothetical protein T11_15221 [Trichinella zimbabwensis]